MSVDLEPFVDMNLGAGWVEVSEDVVSSVVAEWGIQGGSPKERVADPGSLSLEMNNDDTCSGGVRGYYSPGHPDCRPGFGVGTPVRYGLKHATLGRKPKWEGTIESATPMAGVARPTTRVKCEDWMAEAARAKLSGLEVQQDIQSDAAFLLLAESVARQPPGGIVVGSGSDVYTFAFDNSQDENTKVLTEIRKLVNSEYAIAFESAGVLTFEGRRRRASGGAVRFAMDEDVEIVGLTLAHERDDVVNRVQVAVHPRRRDPAATTVLFSLGSSMYIPRNTSRTITCPYRDPNQQAQRVGGIDMVTPVAGVDYIFTANEDGTGADITAQLDADVVFWGNSAEVTLSNNGPADGYVPAVGLQLRGRGLYDFEPVIADQLDQDSIDAYGENNLAYDMPYQSSVDNATDLALFLLALGKDPSTRVESVTFVANWSDEVAEQALNLEISERVSITAASLGLDARPFYVNGVRHEAALHGRVLVTYYLAPVDTSEYWLLETDGRTELDETTVLGFGLFVPGWILDSSEVGTDTFAS